jgi:mRNA-degrading endonuclease RelE of RelBE toxin-antitoxin system
VSWTVLWAERARSDLRRLDRQTAARVERAVGRLAETEQGDVTRLKGQVPPQWRLRVGDWRVRFRFERDSGTLLVLRVLPRGRAYRD